MKYQYDLSIIIPVYNNELYIDDCLKSILKQHYPQNKIQVIAVNDGSNDSGEEVLSKYKKHHNFTIINKENTGVSDTRNVALSKATGKYIMFLDSDDFISSNACKLIYQTFEKYYDEADLLVYPLYRYNNETKKTNLIARFKSFAETGVYDLEKQYYLFNPTMNVVIKNQFAKNPQFDTNFFFHEDEQFVAGVVYKKKKIIYLKEASYYYRIHATSTSSLKAKPYYSYNQYIRLYEEFVKKYTENNHMVKYIQYSIFNDIKWRVKDRAFFPEYLAGEAYENEIKRIKNIFKYIDDELIYKDKNLSIYYIMYFLKNFKSSIKDFKVEIKDGIYNIYYQDNLIFRHNSVELNMYKFKIDREELDVCIAFKVPFVKLISYDLYEVIEYQDKKIENKLLPVDINVLRTGKSTEVNIEQYVERKYANPNKIKSIYYYLKAQDEIIPTQFIFSGSVPFNKSLHRFVIKYNKGVITANPNSKLRIYDFKGNNILKDKGLVKAPTSEKIIFRKFNLKKDLIPTIKVHLRMLKRNPLSYFYRLIIKQKKNTWIYVDQYDVLEEAYLQFLHDQKINDGITRYYVTSNKKILKQKNIISRKSLKFRNLSYTANKIITSHITLGEYHYPYKNYSYFTDKFTRELIFINNKDLKYKTIKELRKFESNIDKIIVSNQSEKQEYITNYYYLDKDIIIGGYPSYDEYKPQEIKENKILFSVNWRKDLIKRYNPLTLNTENLENNKLYQTLKELMTSKDLNNLLKDNNLELDLNFNNLIKDCENYLKEYENNNLKIVSEPNIDEYKLLITDTSNIVIKYLRNKRPIIYYLYDEEYFRANFHIFNDLTVEDNFVYGPTINNLEDLLKEINKVIKNKYLPESKYLQNINNNQVEVTNCQDKIYDAIKDVK